MKIFRPLLAGLLLFAFALPVAAADETSPTPEAVLYSVSDPVPCSDEIATAVANGSGPGAVFEACLLPDGTLLPVNAATRAAPGASAEPCPPEVIAAAESGQVITDAICLLPDGSLYAPAVRGVTSGDAVAEEISMTSEVTADSDMSALLLVGGIAAAGGVLVLVMRRRRAA